MKRKKRKKKAVSIVREPKEISLTSKTMMTFRIAPDIAVFLETSRKDGKNMTSIIENAIRKIYMNENEGD